MLVSLRSQYVVLSVCGLLALALPACSNSSPTSPGGGSGSTGTGGGGTTGTASCRIFASALRLVTTGAGVTQTQDASCNFNSSMSELNCSASYSDTLGSMFASTWTTRYPSVAAFVNEVSVNPPRRRALSSTTTIAGASIGSSTTVVTYSYDGQERLIREESATNGVTTTLAYSAWDMAGRPTAGTHSAPGVMGNITFSYNEAARSETIVRDGVSCTNTYDANGIYTGFTCNNGAVATQTTMATQQVCG